MQDKQKVITQANKELNEEAFADAVIIEKRKILERRGRSFWSKLFPFKIVRIKHD